jgi:hypothetical protein
MGFEPTTFSLATRSSTTELRPHGGSGGIRTHGTREGTLVFKTRSIDHSDTLPNERLTVTPRVLIREQPHNWCVWQVLTLRPLPYQGSALPTELQTHIKSF